MPPVVASQTPIPVVQTNPAAPSSEAAVAPKEAEQSAAEVRADSVDNLPQPVVQEPLILGIQPEDKVLTQESEEQPAANRISPELLKRFEKAVAAIDETPGDLEPQSPTPQNGVTPVQELPAWILTQLPSISFSTHMYASQADERWVRVNGKRVTEGQEIEPGLRVVNIEPQHVILAFKGQEFSMEALSDW
ncbi:MAG: general secretion pathway protein GspB [Wenzhouxiangellaceae bacterium]